MTYRTLATRLVHAGSTHTEGAVVQPIFASANYLQDGAASYGEVRYLRLSNSPQQRALATKLAVAEEADDAFALASGMAAISTTLLALLSSGDHLLVQDTVYGGTETLLGDLQRLGISHTRIDATRPEAWAQALRPETRLLYVESVSNPLMEVADLPAAAAFARDHGLVSVVDNTFLSPVQLRPATLGFDLVLHSATKYLGGHSDLVAGAVAGRRDLVERVRTLQHHLGGSLDPFSCFLLDRGLKTLHLRVPRQASTALRLARMLREHPAVRQVRYPGLPDDPGHLRADIFEGYGGMLAFEADSADRAARFLERVRIPVHAASLGGTETLVVQPARSSHLGLSPEERARRGITDALVRVSVGVEDPDELLDDIDRALR